MRDMNGALEDAKEALALAPYYPEASIAMGINFLELKNIMRNSFICLSF